MSSNRQLVNWIITVLIGSLITAIGLAVISFEHEPFEFYIFIFLTSCLISFFASIPIMIGLALQLRHLKKQNTELNEMRKTLFFTHIIGAFCTFAFLHLLMEFPKTLKVTALLMLIYLGMGLLLWHFEFRRLIKEASQQEKK